MTSEFSLHRLLEPIRRRIALMFRRAVASLVKDENPVQIMQLKMFRGECRSQVERIQEYGFSSVPMPGAQAVAACVDGECGHELVIATDDRRYRPRKKAPGSLMLYTCANKNPDAKDAKDGEDADTEHHLYFDPETRLMRIRAKDVVIDVDESMEIRTKDGANCIKIGKDYGIRITADGGFENGGSDLRLKDGQIWEYGAEKLVRRTKVNRTEEPPAATGETGGPTMPE